MLINLFRFQLKEFVLQVGSANFFFIYFNYLTFTLYYLLTYYYKKVIFILLLVRRHLFHLVSVSPWPFFSSVFAFSFFMSFVFLLYSLISFEEFFLWCIYPLVLVMFAWWSDIIRESTFLGYHTLVVQRGLRIGVVLFIISEIFFFFGFFWAFFHSSLSVSVELGCIWPPVGIDYVSFLGVPLLNTFLLLTSGAFITVTHHSLAGKDILQAFTSLFVVLEFSYFFIYFQGMEYVSSNFNISDSVYGSVFYMLTGFHGFHVIVGSIFLYVCLLRFWALHFRSTHHVGFEAAAWYWHFVDVVWLFLFISIYWWGSILLSTNLF